MAETGNLSPTDPLQAVTCHCAGELEAARSLFENAPIAYHELDSTGRIVRVNAAERRLLGFGADEMIGRPIWDFVCVGQRADVRTAIERNLRTPEALIPVEREYIRRDGSAVPVQIHTSRILDGNGATAGFRSLLLDITEQRRTERELEAKAKELARSNAELQQFAYVASHDLQEPLRMIASYTQLLARRYVGKLGPEADEFIGFAVDGAKRMQQLIQDLLAYSRVGTRGQEFRPVSAESVLSRAVDNLRAAISESGAAIRSGALPFLCADPLQLTQLFQNLLGNAIKFRKDAVPEILVSGTESETEWQFSVADNGIGIEARHADRIFQVFQRLHTREQYPGTGIGLAICKKIVERHGGRIWVESVPEQGTTFQFTIAKKSVAELFRPSQTAA